MGSLCSRATLRWLRWFDCGSRSRNGGFCRMRWLLLLFKQNGALRDAFLWRLCGFREDRGNGSRSGFGCGGLQLLVFLFFFLFETASCDVSVTAPSLRFMDAHLLSSSSFVAPHPFGCSSSSCSDFCERARLMLPLILPARATAELASEWATYEAPTPNRAARVLSSLKLAADVAGRLVEAGAEVPAGT